MTDIIYDGDMGGDDLWAVAVLASLVKQNKINLIGVTTCFGNTNVAQGTRNVLDMMDIVGIGDIPVYQGLEKPISGLEPLLDGAYGSNGLSNATLPSSSLQPQSQHAVEWMADTLLNTDNPITIICTGPLSNIAKAYQQHPELDTKGHEILWLGGSIMPAGGGHVPVTLPDGSYKCGNITHFAEFNAINDPMAAQMIANLEQTKVTIIPLDCTHHMAAGFIHGTQFLRDMKGREAIAIQMLSMLDNAAILEETKFKIFGACLHDPQVIVYLQHPELFLSPVPVTDIQFQNNHEAAKNFDAVKSGFDFSSLTNHGQMTAKPTDKANKYIVPGLTTFEKVENITKTQIDDMAEMAFQRWEALRAYVQESLNHDTD
jgi:inosine-uridine nucleoside N-ribohydrolase